MSIDAILFTQAMSSLLKTSLSMQDSLLVCSEIMNSKKDSQFCKNIYEKVSEGNMLSKALESYTTDFSRLYIELIKIGEESSTLPEVFERLSDYLKVKKDTNDKIKQSLFYPILVLITAVIVVGIVIFLVFPRMEMILDAFVENSLDLSVKILEIKRSVVIAGLVLICIFICFVIMAILHRTNSKMRFVLDGFVLRLPLIGKIVLTTQTNEFSFSMKLLTSSYLSFIQSLKLSSLVVSNEYYKKCLENIHKKISDGDSIGESFASEKILPSYLVVWIKTAERNGDTAGVFNQIYSYYSSERANIVSGITTSIEPIFILITGLIIVFVISQFVLPIFKIMGTL